LISPAPNPSAGLPTPPTLARKLGLFDASMIVMGGIVGAGIFINPYVVARQVRTPVLILGAWIIGGVIALAGAFVYAELAARLPDVGGQYAYLRQAYHPAIAFLYGWVLLLVIQTGGMAAVSITFARYLLDLTGAQAPDWLIGAVALAVLTLINCLGVKQGSAVQSTLMVMKIIAIAALVFCGAFLLGRPSQFTLHPLVGEPPSLHLLSMFGAAMVPVLFAYGGWQTASFIGGEIRDPRRNLPRGLLIGVGGVIALYVGVSWVCLRALGPAGLAHTQTPASAVMRVALGEAGSKLIAAGIAISTLGFLSQSILTAPRVYFAMAGDGLFFRAVARIHPRSRVPVVAIVLQSLWTMVIAVSGRYEQILNYVVSMDFIFFGLTATCIFVFRRRDAVAVAAAPHPPGFGRCASVRDGPGYRVPGHPVTTALFVAACWLVVANTIYRYPRNSLVGLAMLAAGVPVYFLWRTRGSGRR
jgi:APA family basic amino acid/polyamine antiporter